MSAPSSVVKISQKKGKTSIEYVSNVDAANYYLFELSRAALRDVGKFVAKKFKESYYLHFKKITGNAGRVTKYKVYSGRTTLYPRVEIGVKTGKIDGFYAYFQEFGTSKTQKLGLLSKVVEDNVAEIIKIESQYLSGLESEAEALRLVESENDYEGDGDE